MIGHYLLTLTPEQEARVLTKPFVPVSDLQAVLGSGGCQRCLVMVAEDKGDWTETSQSRRWVSAFLRYPIRAHRELERDVIPGMRYERLCKRFGYKRVNAAIRNRILANIARRTLTPVAEVAHVG